MQIISLIMMLIISFISIIIKLLFKSKVHISLIYGVLLIWEIYILRKNILSRMMNILTGLLLRYAPDVYNTYEYNTNDGFLLGEVHNNMFRTTLKMCGEVLKMHLIRRWWIIRCWYWYWYWWITVFIHLMYRYLLLIKLLK